MKNNKKNNNTILDTHKGKIEGERQNGCWGEGMDGVDGVRGAAAKKKNAKNK